MDQVLARVKDKCVLALVKAFLKAVVLASSGTTARPSPARHLAGQQGGGQVSLRRAGRAQPGQSCPLRRAHAPEDLRRAIGAIKHRGEVRTSISQLRALLRVRRL
jgi:hypothetical protein